MAPDRVLEAAEIAGNALSGLGADVEHGPPDQRGSHGLGERLYHGVDQQFALPDFETRMRLWRRSAC